MMRQSDYFEEFEALGEAEVKARLDQRGFDRDRQLYAARWLSATGSARFAALQRDDEARRRRKAVETPASALQTAALGFAVIAAIVAIVFLLPTLTSSSGFYDAMRGVFSLAHRVREAVSPT